MTRSTLDYLVGGIAILVLGAGAITTLQAYRATTDGMRHGSGMHGISPIWNLLGTVVVAGVLVALYLVVRENLHGNGGEAIADEADRDGPTAPDVEGAEPAAEATGGPAGTTSEEAADGASEETTGRASPADRDVKTLLRLLPEDERRVLTPVVESPGITQVELRDRADFSKAKVSQTLSELEKRGLVSRERQGRTYRVYPAGEVSDK